MNQDLSLFGNRLRALREEKNVSLRQAAKEMKIGKSSLSNYENGNRNPGMAAIKKLSNYYEQSVDYIIGTSPRKAIKKIAN